jgi:hypothetical protein
LSGVAHAAADRGHGRITTRTIQVLPAPGDLPFPHVSQAYLIERHVTALDGHPLSDVAALGVTSLTADRTGPARLTGLVRSQRAIESLHWLRSPGVPRLSHDVAPEAPRRAFATHLQWCGARCRCWSDARRLGTGRLVQHLWRDYPLLINR